MGERVYQSLFVHVVTFGGFAHVSYDFMQLHITVILESHLFV